MPTNRAGCMLQREAFGLSFLVFINTKMLLWARLWGPLSWVYLPVSWQLVPIFRVWMNYLSFQLLKNKRSVSLQRRNPRQWNLKNPSMGMYCSWSVAQELTAQLSHVKPFIGHVGGSLRGWRGLVGGMGQVLYPWIGRIDSAAGGRWGEEEPLCPLLSP